MEILPGGYLLDSENEDLELIYLIHDKNSCFSFFSITL